MSSSPLTSPPAAEEESGIPRTPSHSPPERRTPPQSPARGRRRSDTFSTPVEYSLSTPATGKIHGQRALPTVPKFPHPVLENLSPKLQVRLHSPENTYIPPVSRQEDGTASAVPLLAVADTSPSSFSHLATASSRLQALTEGDKSAEALTFSPPSPAVTSSQVPVPKLYGVQLRPPSFPPGHSAFAAGKVDVDPDRHVAVAPGEVVYKGETIMRATPTIQVLNHALMETHCSGCLLGAHEKAKKAKRRIDNVRAEFLECSRCNCVVYCSMKCYVKDWRLHQYECKALCNDVAIPISETRLLARAVFARTCLAPKEMDRYWTAPMSVATDVETAETVESVIEFVKLVKNEAEVDWTRYALDGVESLKILIRTVQCALFPIRDSYDFNIGMCLCDTVSKFQHSCQPNAFIAYPDGLAVDAPLRVIALDDQFGDDEFFISYVDLEIPCYMRTENVAAKGFTHDCEWCDKEMAEVDVRFCMKHEDCTKDGVFPLHYRPIGNKLPEAKCTKCGVKVKISSFPHQVAIQVFTDFHEENQTDFWTFGHEQTANREEIDLLMDKLVTLTSYVPDTFFPLPHLHLRLAKLLMLLPEPSIEDIEKAIEELEVAHAAYAEVHHDECKPITLAILFHMIMCHAFIIETYLREGTNGPKVYGGRGGGEVKNIVYGRRMGRSREAEVSAVEDKGKGNEKTIDDDNVLLDSGDKTEGDMALLQGFTASSSSSSTSSSSPSPSSKSSSLSNEWSSIRIPTRRIVSPPLKPVMVRAPDGTWFTRPRSVLSYTVSNPVDERVRTHIRLARDVIRAAKEEARDLYGEGQRVMVSRDIERMERRLNKWAEQAGLRGDTFIPRKAVVV